ncbi:glycosyltransferase family protein [Dongia soli]|uniref:Glycosyltransferase n=1 Tax=Dongia soli TaxID=600628 RepID=A0ABU5E761_9PROT|nr:glycosyltransferase [Dongia soli]MDY0882023.1 glycosyltransferase [Dongia soli]
MTARVFFYVQHLLGIGHLRRAAAIARGLREAGATVDFVSGGMPVEGLDIGGAQLIQLPPATAADSGFSAILDADGKPIDESWKAARRDRLLTHFAAARPDILLVEMYPFGRRQFRFELLPLLEAAAERRNRPLIACSLRDILVDKGRPDRLAEAVDLVKQRIDLVLVHGDPRLVTFDRTFAGAPAIADRLHYTGYVVERPVAAASADRERGEILVSAGGGAVGAPLLSTALAARPLSRHRKRPWHFITGRNLPARDAEILRHAAAPDIIVETFRPDFTRLLQSCLLSVSQGGYNTVMELIAARCPAVIVPFAEGAESEQSLRAALLAERGVFSVLPPAELTAQNLAAAIDRHHSPAAAFALDLDGARRSADILLRRGEGLR